MTNKYIYSLKLCRQLCDLGFKVVETIPNPKKPWYNIYLFENTKELNTTLAQIFQEQEDNTNG